MRYISISVNFIINFFRYLNKKLMGGQSAYVGLAAPGEVGSWQRESKVIN